MAAPPHPSDADDLALIIAAAKAAGDAARAFFRPGARTTAPVRNKDGGSPVSEADLLANRILHDALLGARPDYGWLSEETADSGARLDRPRVFIVDPIDGTRGFIAGEPAWTVCVAVVEAGNPIAGVVHAPAEGVTYAATSGGGATINGVRCRITDPGTRLRAAGPGGMLKRLEEKGLAIAPEPRGASLANRLMQLVAGRVDLALASPGSHEWDIAAAALIIAEAGGRLAPADGGPIIFNRALARLPALIAAAPDVHAKVAGLLG
jgi:myo-inositol-1(or 4)-monophosphatase